MNTKKLIIGSRGSELALWQANYVQSQLQKLGCETQIKIIKTQGDIIQNLNFDKLEGKGFFTKEIEDALLKNDIDLAIHSHKDLPTENTPGLTIAAVSEREEAIDCIFIHPLKVDLSEPLGIKKGSVIATSSARRKSQIKMLQSNLVIKDIRGNVPTRLNKVRTNNYDAVVLAIAGVKRLQLNTSDLV
ncbi:MAG: hydroxymethylbilane synthase, partial [Bacteroidota bacterium]